MTDALSEPTSADGVGRSWHRTPGPGETYTVRSKHRRKQRRDATTSESEVDMTPMIDVVFLLIVFFLCIDFKILESKLPPTCPRTQGQPRRRDNGTAGEAADPDRARPPR
ncbi:MAG: biopolymer transporter ExbD [Planctomycetes bacterium]|nr:biopolymer transporter ExbD [Planctomycetota bacterium]